jgi:chemotaxis protein methyltransferase CheR
MKLTGPTFDELRRLIQRLCGLVLNEDKAYLIRHRLEPLARSAGCHDFEELAARLRGPGGAALHDAIVEAITTPETSFFRDGHPFETFRRHLLPLYGAGVRIWCAAVSTGQEAYSAAMLLADYLEATGAPAGAGEGAILATDVSARVLRTAEAGSYSEREVARGLTPAQVTRYFERHGERRVVRPQLRRLVRFRRLNLVGSLAGLGPFDIVFCRNVLIYFDDETRRRLCRSLAGVLVEGGWLLLGSAENLYGISEAFESVHLGPTLVYRKVGTVRG